MSGRDPRRSDRPVGVDRGIAAAAGLVAMVTLLSRAVGFARWLEFSRSVGATCVGTVYQSANSVPNVLFEVAAGGALAAVAVPLIGNALGRGQRAEADRIGSALLTWTLALLVPAAGVLVLVAPWAASLLVDDGQCPGSRDLAATMLRLFAPQVPLYGLGIVLAGILQSHRRFLAAALAPLLSSLVVIGSYTAYGRLADGARAIESVPPVAVLVLAGGTTLGVVLLSLPLVVPTLRLGIRLRPTFSFPPGAARRLGTLAGAGLLALVAQQYAVLATLVTTRRAGTGVLNVSTYVQTLYLLPYAVLAVPLAVSAFPALATRAGAAAEGSAQGGAQGGADDVATLLARTLRATVLLAFAGAGVLAAVATPLGGFFAELDAGRTGIEGRSALAELPHALLALLPGLPAFCVAALLTRALYVRGRPILAGAAVAAGWLIAGSLPLALVPPGSTPGRALVVLGLASSLGMTLASLELVAATGRTWGPAALTGLRRTAAAGVVAASVVAAVGTLVTRAWVVHGLLPSLGQGVAVGAAALAVLVAVVAVADRPTVRLVRQRVRRRST